MTETEYEIHYLADKPEHIEACAAWAYGRWGVQKTDGSLDRAMGKFRDGARKNDLPLTIVAVNKYTNLPMAMASLWEQDGDLWTDCTPWIAGVYTLYRYRGMGLAKALIEQLEEEARRLGFNQIFLKAGSAAGYYPTIGYMQKDKVKEPESASGHETLFVKPL